MSNWIDQVKEALPEYAKDIKLNIDNVINRSTLGVEEATAIALAAAIASGNRNLSVAIGNSIENQADKDAASAAAVIMAQNNVWYPYTEMANDDQLKGLPAQLRMTVIGSHGGTTKARFEAYSLAASIVGKCHFCVKAHYDVLRKEGYTVEQLRDIGRIAAVVNALAKALNI